MEMNGTAYYPANSIKMPEYELADADNKLRSYFGGYLPFCYVNPFKDRHLITLEKLDYE